MILILQSATNSGHCIHVDKLRNPPPVVDAGESTHFYTVYTNHGWERHTIKGSLDYVTMLREIDKQAGRKVSAIIPNLQLSEQLKYRYTWKLGKEEQELRKEYRALNTPKAEAQRAA